MYDVRTLGGGGVGSKADDSTDRLCEWDSDKGEVVQKSQIFADIICEWHLKLSFNTWSLSYSYGSHLGRYIDTKFQMALVQMVRQEGNPQERGHYCPSLRF